MITREIKMEAIAQINLGIPLPDIAANMDIPLPLVQEWSDKEALETKSDNDLVAIAANIHAVRLLERGEIIPKSSDQEELLKIKIEEVALDIVDQISLTVASPDILRAKTLQLCADTVTKLYNSMVAKVTSADGSIRPDGQTISAFKSLMRE